MRTIAVINQKGGCGKTTASINLAAAIAKLGHKTLLVDMDPQSHCALGLAVPESRIAHCIADALLAGAGGAFDLHQCVWQISAKLDLVPSSTHLAAVEHQLAGTSDRDLRLSKLLRGLGGEYEVCVIDCPPSIGLLTFNAMRAAGEVLIPVETGYFSLSGAIKQAATLQMLADRVAHELAFYVLPTMYDDRTTLAGEIVGELRKHFGDRVLDFTIQYSTQLREAASFGQPISEYAPASVAAADFDRLAKYLLSQNPASGRRLTRAVARQAGQPSEPSPHLHETNLSHHEPQIVETRPGGERLADLIRRAKALAERSRAAKPAAVEAEATGPRLDSHDQNLYKHSGAVRVP